MVQRDGRATSPESASQGSGDGTLTSTDLIVRSVTDAIVEHRLMPGTKLAEQKLADIYGVSRTVVRQALMQLARDRLVTIEPARGAHVAMPSVEEARQIFDLRRMIETRMIERLCMVVTDGQLAALREHLAREARATGGPDVPRRTRLLGDFHVVLARMLGNDVLTDTLADLTARTSLVTLLYQSARSAVDSAEEHVRIVDALERRRPEEAAEHMHVHLENVELNLRLDPRTPDLGAVLRGR